MNSIISFLITEKNIPETSIVLLLMLPIVTTIIAFWRQIIGLRTFSIYGPIIMTYSFYKLGIRADSNVNIIQGLKYGIALSAVIFISTHFFQALIKKIRLHYLPKISIILSLVSFSVFFAITIASYLNKNGFINVDIFPVLLLITISEQQLSISNKKGSKTALILSIGTAIISSLIFVLISLNGFHRILLHYPFISLISIIINYIIGKFTGFRIREYFRFKTILSKDEYN